MFKRTEKHGRILIAALSILFLFPMISMGNDKGRDWDCPDPAGHATYEKHLKIHLDHGAEAINASIEKIYNDPSLTPEQKKAKTMAILNTYLSKAKTSSGLGD